MVLTLPRSIKENINYFTGRTWLLPHLLNWYQQGNTRIFSIVGEPGSGKSMTAAWLSGAGPKPTEDESAELLEQIRSKIKAIHFCIAASGSISPKNFAQNIAEQLTLNVPGFGSILVDSFMPQIKIDTHQHIGAVDKATGVYIGRFNLGSLDDEASLNNILWNPLRKLYIEGYKEQIVLLIDALDEARTYTGTINIVQILAKIEDLPEQVRFIITTRPDPRVLKYFRQFQSIDLINSTPLRVDDVKIYVYERLSHTDEVHRIDLTEKISKAADGNFLYANLALNELLSASTEVPSIINSLPKHLSGFYSQFLNRELGANEDKWYEIFKPLLGIVGVAQGEGLNKSQIERITNREMEPALRACSQFLEGDFPQGPFRLFHQSFSDYLLEDKYNIDYHIDQVIMHRIISDFYLALYNDKWDNCELYCLRNLARHLFHARNHKELYHLLTSSKNWMDAKATRFGNDNDYREDLELALSELRGDLPPSQLLELIKLHAASVLTNHHRGPYYDASCLQALVFLNHVEEALQYALINSNTYDFNLLLAIYQSLKEKESNNVDFLLEALTKAAHIIPDVSERIWAFAALSTSLHEEGLTDLALETAQEAFSLSRTIQNDFDRALCLIKIAETFAKINCKKETNVALTQAELAIDAIEILSNRTVAMKSMAEALLRLKRTKKGIQAFKKANELALTYYRQSETVRDLCEIAVSLTHFGYQKESKILFDQVYSMIASTDLPVNNEDDYDLAFQWRFLAEAFAQVGRFDESKDALEKIKDEIHRKYALSIFLSEQALYMLQSDKIEDALTLARSIPHDNKKAEVLSWIALKLAKTKQEEKVVSLLREISMCYKESQDSAFLSRSYLSKIEVLMLFECVDSTLQLISDISEPFHADDLLNVVAVKTAEIGMIERALSIVRLIDDPYEKVEAMGKIAHLLFLKERIDEIQTIFEEITTFIYEINSKRYLVGALCMFGKTLYLTKQTEMGLRIIKSGIDIACNIPSGYEDVLAPNSEWGFIASTLAELGLIEELIDAIQSIKDKYDSVSIMAGAASILLTANYEEQGLTLFEKAKNTANLLKLRTYRAYAMRDLATRLAEANLFDEAERIVDILPDEDQQQFAKEDVILVKVHNMAKSKHFEQALTLRVSNRMNRFDDFISALLDWMSAFEEFKPGFSKLVIMEVIKIAGWELPDWQEIYTTLIKHF